MLDPSALDLMPPRPVISRLGWLVVAAFVAACGVAIGLGWALGDSRSGCFRATLSDGRPAVICALVRGELS